MKVEELEEAILLLNDSLDIVKTIQGAHLLEFDRIEMTASDNAIVNLLELIHSFEARLVKFD